MATLALGAIGSATPLGPVGGMLGSMAGSLIDGFVTNKMFGSDSDEPSDGIRLADIRVGQSAEGAQVAELFGDSNRIAGQVIWMGNRRKVKQEIDVGKGGGGVTVMQYDYFVDLAILWCKAPVTSIDKIWANSKLVWKDGGTDFSISGSDIRTRHDSKYNGSQQFSAPSGGTNLLNVGPPGVDVTITGSLSANNGTFKVIAHDTTSNGTRVVWVDNPNGEPGGDPAHGPHSVTFEGTRPESSEQNWGTAHNHHLDTTAGDTVDSIMDAAIDDDDVPAYRGDCYTVIESFRLNNFGTQIPRFEARINESTRTSASAISAVLDRSGFSASQYDVTGLATKNFPGLVVAGAQRGIRLLEMCMLLGDCACSEDGGVLTFFDNKNETTIAVDENDLRAHQFGTQSPPPISIREKNGWQEPNEVGINFVNGSSGRLRQGYKATRRNERTFENMQKIELPMTIGPGRAKKMARLLLYDSETYRRSLSLYLPPSYLHVMEGDLLTFTYESIDYQVHVLRVTEGANRLLEIQGVVVFRGDVDPDGDDTVVDGEDDDDDNDIYTPPPLTLELLDVPALVSEHVTQPGHYWALCASSPESAFLSGSLWRSATSGGTFDLLGLTAVEAVIGATQTELAPGPVGYWDLKNTVDVVLYEGSLSSITETEALASGKNTFVIGNEIIQALDVEELDIRTYRLSTLLRGLRDTRTDGHVEGERFLRPEPTTTVFRNLTLSDNGNTAYFKALSESGDLADSVEQSLEYGLETMRCFAPVHLTGTWDGGFNLSWERQTRAFYDPLSGNDPPLLENDEQYEVDLLDLNGIVSSTHSVTGATALTISASDCNVAGYPSGSSVRVRIYQVGAVGRGHYTEQLVVPE